MTNRVSDSGPAALFMKAAALAPEFAMNFVLRSVLHVLDLSGTTTAGLEGVIDIAMTSPESEMVSYARLHVDIAVPALASEMVAADDLRVEPRYVISNKLMQARIVAFIGHRVVAQLFSSRDGQTLRLEVEELRGARDLGNGVVAIENLNASVHTPLGSVRKNSNLH